jgi:hypothetical protein
MKRLSVLLLILLLVGCTQARIAIVQPALNEEVVWVDMLQQWSGKAYGTADFYAGLTTCALVPFDTEISGRMRLAIDGVTKGADTTGVNYKTGCAGGARLAFYGVSVGQEVMWVINKLISIGVPITIGG